MIEPDINEQMSNFAPSQNAEDLLRSAAPQEGLSMTEAIMPRASMPLPAAPKQPMLDPGLQAAVDEMASQRSAVMNASLYNASKKNPDTVGEAQRLAQQMGVGADIAERNLEEMRRGAAMVRALDRNLATSAPRTANALTEPDFANIAFDDLENLTGAEKLMRWYAGTDFFKGAQGTFIQTEMSIIDQLNSEGMATPKDFERYKELQRDLQIVGSPTEGSWTGSFANILASVGAGVPDAAEYAVIGANVGGVAGAIGGPFAPATVPAGLMLGASAGFATGMAKWMYQAMAGESYRQLREAEVPHDVAVPVSRGVGVITSALEFAGLGAEVWIASGVGKKLFAKEVATEVNAKLLQELTRRATLRGAVYEGAKLYVGEKLAESTVEATQTLITRVGSEIARSYSRPDLQNMLQTPEGRRAIIGEAVDAFVSTAKGMALMAAPLPVANFYIDRGRAADAQRSQKFYEDLSKNAVDSKVRQRNPDAAERHFAAVMDSTGAETTYVNAHVMQNILNQAGVTADQVDSVLPGLSRQLADALAQGGDVTMPTATWAAKLAGTKLGDAMKPHMRPNAQAWSADTAAKYQAEVEQRKAEALAIEAEKETTDSTFVDEARAIEKEALTQLEAAGQDKTLAKLNARIYRDMVVVMAANPNRNQTPAQVHAEIGPDIFGPQGMQTAAGVASAVLRPPDYSTNAQLFGWNAQWGLASVAKKQGVNLANLTREEYVQFAIDNGFRINDDQLRMATTLRNATSMAEYQALRKSMRAAATPQQQQADAAFSSFAQQIKRDATSSKQIANGIRIRSGTANSDTWLYFKVNSGANITGNTYKAYAGFSNPYVTLTPDRVTQFMELLQFRGYNGDIKTIQDLDQGSSISDQIVMHGATEADARLAQQLSREFFGNELTFSEVGMDSATQSYSQILSDKIDSQIAANIAKPPIATNAAAPQTQASATLTETETKPLQTALGELATRAEEHNARMANEGLEESHPQAKAGRALKDSVRRLNDAINANDEVEIAHQAWRFRNRLETLRQNLDANAIAAVEEMLAKLDAFMQQRGIEIHNPIGEKYVDGWDEVDVVSWEEVDKKNPEPDTIKQTVRPIIRRNGQVASRGQVIATYATEADLKRHEEKYAQRKAELLARAESRQVSAPLGQPAPVLEQAAAGPERGPPRGQYDANRIAILLNTKASATTFFHELIHWRMDMAIRMVNQGKASAQEAADVDTLFKSFGIAGDTPQERLATWNKMSIEQQRPHWEAVAYNSEIYLFEGKAPSVEMQGVFDRLHAFVKRVYVSIKTELNDLYRQEFGKDLPILTGEVREVMDRWLASEEQIQRKQAMMQMVPLFLTQEESGMDDATWAQHQQANKEAEEVAVTDLTKASLRQMEWLSGARSRILKKLQSLHDDLRKKTRAEVMEEVKNEPVYAAMSILKTGEGRAKNGELVKFNDKFKLNLEMVKKMLPEEQVRQLGYGKYGMVAADGISPDMVAEMVGFSSGDELVLAILAAKPLKEEVDARTDRRMMEEHGELNTPQAMEEAVQRALHNEARARFNAVYVRFLSKSTAPVQAFMDATKLAARQIISGKVIRDLRPGDHQAAEAKAARDAAEAHKSRRTAEQAAKAAETKERNVGLSAAAAGVPMTEVETAAAAKGQEAAQRVAEREAEYKAKYGDRTPEQVMLRAKQIQLLQNQLAREAQEAKDEVAKAVKDFRKFFKADDKLAKTRNMDLVDAARAILSAFGFGKSDKSPAEYIDKLKAYNPEMYAAIEPLVMAATSGSKNYKDLTVEQFRQLREVVDALWEQSRRDKLVEIDGKMVALADVVGELETRLDEIGVPKVVAGERGAPTTKDRAVRGFYDAKAVMRRVEHWADATDGAKGVGPFTKYIWRPIKDAINAYRIDRNKYVKKYVELLKQVVLPEGKIESKELDYTFGNANGGIGKAELLGALMHTGNDSNKKKLLVGRGWGSINEDGTLDSSRWDAFVARMIKQGVLTKSDFDFVQATWDLLEEVKPIAQKAHRSIFGFYFKEVEATPFTNEFGTFRGGYVPAKTDAFIVRDAQRQSKMEELEGDFRNSMPSTGMGFTKGRVEYNKPLSMDVRLVTKHIDDVLRFAHVQPAIKDVLRILKNRGFSDKLSRIDPTVVEDMLIPWLNRAARQVTSEPGRNKQMDKFWKTVRSRTGISIMAANLRNAMQQVTGLFPSALKVSKTQLGNALLTYMGSPFKTAEEVASLSTFMNERLQSQIFDMQDDINEILLNPNAYNKVVKWTQKHLYFLQSAFQNMVDVVTWTAKYNQVLAESKVGASDTKVQREAIQQADAAVRLTQGSMSAEDISAFEVGTPFYKTFNQFGGYFNMLANLNADEYIKVIRDLGWRGNKGKLLNIYILGFVAPTLVADAIARSMGGGWDDDDDGYLDDVMDWFFGGQARAAVAMIPFGSTAATAITTAFNSKAYDDRITASPSIAALEASTIGVGKTIINIADDDKDVTGKNVRDVMTLISLATGTPVTVLGRPVGYLVDVNRKKVKPTGPIDVARGLVTGVAGGESKKK